MHVFFKKTVGAEQLGKVLETFALFGELLLERLFLFHFLRLGQIGIGINRMDFFEEVRQNKCIGIGRRNRNAPFFRQVGFMLFLVHGEEKFLLNLLKHAAVLIALDEHFHFFKALENVAGLQNVHQLFVLRHTEFDLKQFRDCRIHFLVGWVFLGENRLCLLNEPAAKETLAVCKVRDCGLELFKLVRGDRHRAGDDQRGSGFVDQDRVHFVDDRIEMIALNEM